MKDGGLFRGQVVPWLAVLLVGVASTAAANGAAFFRPVGKGAKVDLAYVGTIKDSSGRRLDFADVTISDTRLGLTFPFANDAPGHFRSPDVGRLIREEGEFVDPSNLEISCFVLGYKKVTRLVPRRSQGILEVNFVMVVDPDQTNRTAPEEPPPRMEAVAGLGCVALLVTALAAYAAVRPTAYQ